VNGEKLPSKPTGTFRLNLKEGKGDMLLARQPMTSEYLMSGTIACTLTPFDEAGSVMFNSVTDQARRLNQIDSVIGIAVSATLRERLILTPEERFEVIRHTRDGLENGQILVSFVGKLDEEVINEVVACRAAGADVIVTFLPRREKGAYEESLTQMITHLAALTDELGLRLIFTSSDGESRWVETSKDMAVLGRTRQTVVSLAESQGDKLLRYDQDHSPSNSTNWPMALKPRPEATLFQDLYTSDDCMISLLAYIAPHEMAALNCASRDGRLLDAQATRTKLAPLIAILSDPEPNTRELICREIAHYRGLLASPVARGISDPLCPQVRWHIHQVIHEIGLRPISWV
jgi:dihydrodipicolinate synthase/N-acetylneuraminate lyase